MARALPAARKHADAPLLSGHGVVAPPPLRIETGVFTGDLGGLFKLAREQRVDLLGIPLAAICEAYVAYRLAAPDASLDEGAAALAILAYLAERKAWLLVPRPETQPEEPEEAMLAIEGLPTGFAEAVRLLAEGRLERESLFFRSAEPEKGDYEVPLDLGAVSPGDLARAFERLLRKAPQLEPENLARPRPNLVETMRAMLGRIAKEPRLLPDLFDDGADRSDLVFGFLALLELIRLGQAVAIFFEGEVTIRRP